MYSKRLKIFFVFCLFLALICITRLYIMQSGDAKENAMEIIESMRDKAPVQLPTLRGKILDRNNKILAIDKPSYFIYVNYNLTRLLDDNWQFAKLLRKLDRGIPEDLARQQLQEEYKDGIRNLYRLIDFCSKLKEYSEDEIVDRIKNINDRVWWLRGYIAWNKYYPEKSFSLFEQTIPDEKQRIEMAAKESIVEMYQNHSLIQLNSEDDKFAAEIAFADQDNIVVSAKSVRDYPYSKTGCQLIGWVKPKYDTTDDAIAQFLASDPLASYQGQELAGFKGIEWVCESYLRGRRGRIQYNKDGKLIEETLTKFGSDVKLTIDVEMQKSVEQMLTDPNSNHNFHDTPTASVIMDVTNGEILTIASLPGFDLNKARENYQQYYLDDPCKPFLNRALEALYPTGSTLKPLILIATMQEKLLNANTIISCPAHNAPRGWPNCWLWRQFGSCHDYQWADSGGNNARNAIKGSCNIYFSHAANMLDAKDLQKWLYNFGFGHRLLPQPHFESVNIESDQLEKFNRKIPESGGVIWSGYAKSSDLPLEQLPEIKSYDKRHFGIGQASMRATVLQVANEMAVIARGGIYRQPRLFIDNSTKKFHSLGISPKTISVVKDGMFAVVNEYRGTARSAFKSMDFKKYGMKVYGKTGSTQNPSHAWFAGFMEDQRGRAISFAVIVEGGQSGAGDAAPLAREIIKICINHDYIGSN